jgi:hypothetical protein
VFTPAEVENTGWLLVLIGAVLLLADWEPVLGLVVTGAGWLLIWRGAVGRNDLNWSRYEDAQRTAGGVLRDGDE